MLVEIQDASIKMTPEVGEIILDLIHEERSKLGITIETHCDRVGIRNSNLYPCLKKGKPIKMSHLIHLTGGRVKAWLQLGFGEVSLDTSSKENQLEENSH